MDPVSRWMPMVALEPLESVPSPVIVPKSTSRALVPSDRNTSKLRLVVRSVLPGKVALLHWAMYCRFGELPSTVVQMPLLRR